MYSLRAFFVVGSAGLLFASCGSSEKDDKDFLEDNKNSKEGLHGSGFEEDAVVDFSSLGECGIQLRSRDVFLPIEEVTKRLFTAQYTGECLEAAPGKSFQAYIKTTKQIILIPSLECSASPIEGFQLRCLNIEPDFQAESGFISISPQAIGAEQDPELEVFVSFKD